MIRQVIIICLCLLLVLVIFVPVSGDDSLPTESPTTLPTTEPTTETTPVPTTSVTPGPTIEMPAAPFPLVAGFSGTPTSGTVPLTVQFNDTSTGSPTSWNWSFGDGNFSTEQDPVYAYMVTGNYTISLNATNSTESSRVIIPEYIIVLPIPETIPVPTTSVTPGPTIEMPAAPVPLVAGFSGTPTSGTVPLTVQFNDTSTGFPTSWNWSFGEGNFSAEQDPVYTYIVAGNYTVSLNATNSTESSSVTVLQYITVLSKSSLPHAQSPLSVYGSRFMKSPHQKMSPLDRHFHPQ